MTLWLEVQFNRVSGVGPSGRWVQLCTVFHAIPEEYVALWDGLGPPPPYLCGQPGPNDVALRSGTPTRRYACARCWDLEHPRAPAKVLVDAAELQGLRTIQAKAIATGCFSCLLAEEDDEELEAMKYEGHHSVVDLCPDHGFWRVGPSHGGLYIACCPMCP